MHFEDLALCEYGGLVHAEEWRVPLKAVGWLEHPHTHSRGVVPSAVRARLVRLRDCFCKAFSLHAYCGIHCCSLCEAATGQRAPLHRSSINIFVPGEGCVYAVPGAIDHYFEVHSYCPPEEFCAAVLRCPDCDTPEYLEALRQSNGGSAPFAQPVELPAEPIEPIQTLGTGQTAESIPIKIRQAPSGRGNSS